MAPTLEKLFTMRLYRSPTDTLNLSNTQGSHMHIITPYPQGYLRSTPPDSDSNPIPSPINATLLQGGSNSIQLNPHATPCPTSTLNARVYFRDTTLGAAFAIRFEGVARMDEHIQKILAGSPEARSTQAHEHYEFIAPVFEVGREEDRWMEDTAWVGHARYVVERRGEEVDVAVEFDVYRLLTG